MLVIDQRHEMSSARKTERGHEPDAQTPPGARRGKQAASLTEPPEEK